LRIVSPGSAVAVPVPEPPSAVSLPPIPLDGVEGVVAVVAAQNVSGGTCGGNLRRQP
jgi:hypothetical protein